MYIGGIGYHITEILDMHGVPALTFALQVSYRPS